MNDDAASILFPNEGGRSAAAPEWFKTRQSQAEQRLMGNHRGQDPASVLFPNDRTERAPAPSKRQPSRPERTESEVAAELFKGDRAPDLHSQAVADVLKPLANDVLLSGDPDRAAELEAATASLSEDFRSAGTDPETVAEVMSIAKSNLANVVPGMPVDADRLAEMEAQAHSWIAESGITDAELSAARRLIDDLEIRTPGIKAFLVDTGAGNDPKMIERAVREAKRRGYR